MSRGLVFSPLPCISSATQVSQRVQGGHKKPRAFIAAEEKGSGLQLVDGIMQLGDGVPEVMVDVPGIGPRPRIRLKPGQNGRLVLRYNPSHLSGEGTNGGQHRCLP